MLDLIAVENLSENDMIAIYSQSSRESKRNFLLKSLSISKFDEDEEMMASIVIDYCLDAICFATDQGFQWSKVLITLKFCFELLNETANEGLQLEEAVVVLKQKLIRMSTSLTVTETKKLMDYLFQTLFQHYSLYLLCMTEERDLDLSTYHSVIEIPVKPDPLTKGTALETWNYQQKMNRIQEEHGLMQNERAEKLQTTLKAIEKGKIEQMDNLAEVCQTSSEDSDLKDILKTLTKLHVEYLESEIQNFLEESKTNVEYTLKKGQVEKPEIAKQRPTSKNRPRSRNKNKLAP